jgi:glycosyltransferase involved in cell wall biosynthesis
MSDLPLVTVVVPIFNAGRFLEDCIESVLAQEYDRWELMLVDDGSTDGGQAIALRYADSYTRRIRFLRHEGGANRGSSATRNLGARYGRGRFVTFLDADDTLYPHTLREQVAALVADPAVGFVHGRALEWRGWKSAEDAPSADTPFSLGDLPTDRALPPRRLLELMLPRKAAAPLMGTLMIRRSIFDAAGGFEEAFTGMYDDQVLVAKANLVSSSYAADRIWSRYRQHPDSMYTVARLSGRKVESRRMYLRWLEAALSNLEPGEAEGLRELVGNELRTLDADRVNRMSPRRIVAATRRALRFAF